MRSHYPDRVSSGGLACSAFARHYSRNRVCFLFLEVLRCFTSLGSLVRAYELSATYGGITRRGFPHSDIACLPTCAYAVFKERAKSWWSRSGSNRRHPACKAGALPAELRPRHQKGVTMVGLDRFELSTPRLSSVCSNQLSYRPLIQATSAPRLSKNRNDALGPSKPESKLTMLTELRTSTLTWLLPAALRPPIAP